LVKVVFGWVMVGLLIFLIAHSAFFSLFFTLLIVVVNEMNFRELLVLWGVLVIHHWANLACRCYHTLWGFWVCGLFFSNVLIYLNVDFAALCLMIPLSFPDHSRLPFDCPGSEIHKVLARFLKGLVFSRGRPYLFKEILTLYISCMLILICDIRTILNNDRCFLSSNILFAILSSGNSLLIVLFFCIELSHVLLESLLERCLDGLGLRDELLFCFYLGLDSSSVVCVDEIQVIIFAAPRPCIRLARAWLHGGPAIETTNCSVLLLRLSSMGFEFKELITQVYRVKIRPRFVFTHRWSSSCGELAWRPIICRL